MALTNGYKYKDGNYYCHHLDLNVWSGPGNNRLNRAGVLNQEMLYHKEFPGVRFRVQRRHSTFNIRPGGRGFTTITDHTPEARPYSVADPHYGPFVSAERGRFTDHRHLFFGTTPVLNGFLTNDAYPEKSNPHEFHLAREHHSGTSNCIQIGDKTWGNRSKIWVPDVGNWDGKWSSGHDFNPYWASIDGYNGPVQSMPRGLKVMLKAEYAARDGKKPEFVFRAEGMKDEGGYYKYLRVTLVFPRYFDSSQPVTENFNPDWWRWALPDGEDGSGRWKFAFLPDVLGDFTLIEPVKISSLSTNWTTRTQQLLAALRLDTGGHGYHAEMLPDFSSKEDFPTLPDGQITLCHLGGLMKSDGTRMPWAKGLPVEDRANDKESIAENIVIEVDNQAIFDELVAKQTPYPAPIAISSPGNLPDEPPTTPPPPSVVLTSTALSGVPGDVIMVSAQIVNTDFLNWSILQPGGQVTVSGTIERSLGVHLQQAGDYTVVCEAVSEYGVTEDSLVIKCFDSAVPPEPEPEPDPELEERVTALEEQMNQVLNDLMDVDARVTSAGTVMAGSVFSQLSRRTIGGG